MRDAQLAEGRQATDNTRVSISARTVVELGEMTLDGDVTARLPDGRTVLVGFGIPGERVELRAAQDGDRRRAEIARIVSPAPSRVTPGCRHFGPCGGCAWQHIAYDEQLALKRRLCERLLGDALGRDAPRVEATLAAPGPGGGPWGYRNKVHFVFTERGGALALGHFRRRSSSVLPVDECPVHAPDGNAMAFRAVDELRSAGVPPASADLRRGTLRHLVIRVAAATGERLLTAVVRRLDRRVPDALVRAASASTAEASVHVNLHDADNPYLFGETTKKVSGHDRLREQIGGVSYLMSPTAFFQTNVAAAEVLVQVVTGAVPASATTVLDLYAGAGLFALPLARRGLRVTAIEEHPGAVADGVAARKVNGIDATRCRFVAARVEDAIGRLPAAPDVVILDPPRGGCERRVLQHVLERLRPPCVIYVSCNPAALASDLVTARAIGYRAARVQPVDMFPHTPHIEAVAVLLPVPGDQRQATTPRHHGRR
jgi:23S rRNA (uracil1939-C5)-methyltransferase